MSEWVKTFDPVKNTPAAIDFFEKINLFHNLLTKSPVVSMFRQTATNQFGLSPKNWKAPFKLAEVVLFATLFGVQQQGF